MENAVIDSCSLIFALKIEGIRGLVFKFFSELLVPPKVFCEVFEYEKQRNVHERWLGEQLFSQGLLKKAAGEKISADTNVLGAGEAEAIMVAKREKLFCISDDRKAYLMASTIGVKVVSLTALIIAAVKQKKVSKQEAKVLLNELARENYYLKPADYARIVSAIDDA